MQRHKFAVIGLAAFTALVMACSRQAASPTSPASTAAASGDAEAGVTLKVTAPVPASPINDVKLGDNVVPTLVSSVADGLYTTAALQYRFQLFNEAGVTLQDSGLRNAPTFAVTVELDFEKRYTWRVRAELDDAVGPWSTTASFITPAGAYLRGNEIRDPLTNGKTVGQAFGCTFIPGVGIRLDGRESYVEYQLETPLVEGQLSAMITNLGNGTETWKTKVLSMMAGDGVNITDNAYRLTIDKRTNWAGQSQPLRYTFVSRGSPSEVNAGPQTWNRSSLYFFEFRWAANQARLTVLDGGINGSLKATIGNAYKGPYSPNPHIVRLGSVFGRGGSDTNPNTIIRNLWVSSRPRPNFPGDTP